MNIGELVKFCKDPPKNPNHCHIWNWSFGLLVEINLKKNIAIILFNKHFYDIPLDWVEKIK